MGEIKLQVGFTPAKIDCDFAEADAVVDGVVELFGSLSSGYEVADEGAYKEAKASRAALNKLVKEFDERRKAVKAVYSAPLNDFEEAVKERSGKVKEYADILGGAVRRYEQRLKDERREVLSAVYAEYAPILAEAVPLERFLDQKLLNRSVGEASAVEQMKAKIDEIATEHIALREQRETLRFFEEDEACFLSTLSLRAALEHDAKRVEETAAIERMRAQQAELQPRPIDASAVVRYEADETIRSYVMGFACTADKKEELQKWVKRIASGGFVAEVGDLQAAKECLKGAR